MLLNVIDLMDGEALTAWGLAGIHTDRFGFKHVWEIWFVPGVRYLAALHLRYT